MDIKKFTKRLTKGLVRSAKRALKLKGGSRRSRRSLRNHCPSSDPKGGSRRVRRRSRTLSAKGGSRRTRRSCGSCGGKGGGHTKDAREEVVADVRESENNHVVT